MSNAFFMEVLHTFHHLMKQLFGSLLVIMAMWLKSDMIKDFHSFDISKNLMNLTFYFVIKEIYTSYYIFMIQIFSDIVFTDMSLFFLLVVFSTTFNGIRL